MISDVSCYLSALSKAAEFATSAQNDLNIACEYSCEVAMLSEAIKDAMVMAKFSRKRLEEGTTVMQGLRLALHHLVVKVELAGKVEQSTLDLILSVTKLLMSVAGNEN